MRKFNFLFSGFLALVLTQCSPSPFEQESLIWMSAPVYLCCNEWEGFGTDENTVEERVQLLFADREIPTTNIWLTDNELQVVCFHCCQCPRDKIINVSIEETLISQAEAFGFRPN